MIGRMASVNGSVLAIRIGLPVGIRDVALEYDPTVPKRYGIQGVPREAISRHLLTAIVTLT